ncbi:MAG: hypothetical protein B7733_21770 [Myxococcales bacterium FL481]|nr:MAG: hypothetical protein B7733_21770 [Myxococcales bacterium FL481]
MTRLRCVPTWTWPWIVFGVVLGCNRATPSSGQPSSSAQTIDPQQAREPSPATAAAPAQPTTAPVPPLVVIRRYLDSRLVVQRFLGGALLPRKNTQAAAGISTGADLRLDFLIHPNGCNTSFLTDEIIALSDATVARGTAM